MAITWTSKWLGFGLDLNQTLRPVSGCNEQVLVAGEGEIIARQISRGARIHCESGMVWLTVNGDNEDYILQAGESFISAKDGRVVIQGMKPHNRVHWRP